MLWEPSQIPLICCMDLLPAVGRHLFQNSCSNSRELPIGQIRMITAVPPLLADCTPQSVTDYRKPIKGQPTYEKVKLTLLFVGASVPVGLDQSLPPLRSYSCPAFAYPQSCILCCHSHGGTSVSTLRLCFKIQGSWHYK